jgi:hypothetical protein
VTSRLLGIPVADVDWADIMTCQIIHGAPNKPDPRMRFDRRYGTRPPKAATRAAS